jgi:hypothetical protein
MIIVKPLYNAFEISIPANEKFLHSSYFRIHYNENPPEDVRKFAEISWEVLSIFKENFPSKFELY